METRRATPLMLMALLCSCATHVGTDGQRETRFDPRYLAKTEIDRVIDTNRAEVMAGSGSIKESTW